MHGGAGGGACMAGGHAWWGGGVMRGTGVYMAGEMATAEDSTHPAGMLSSLEICLVVGEDLSGTTLMTQIS